MNNNHKIEDICEFWNRQAGLGLWAGTRDVIAKKIEIEALACYVKEGMKILDLGCGNGITAIELAKRYPVNIAGIDYAEEMIAQARELADMVDLQGSVSFEVRDVTKMADTSDRYDLIYTERMIINLADWSAQAKAIQDITFLLNPGGRYLMCENSQDGLDRLNGMRKCLDLPAIEPPWHNRYLRDDEIALLRIPGVELEAVNDYSSTYYFISRVLNAAIAKQENREPEYECQLNALAMKLPPFGNVGQGRMWIWMKNQ